MTGAELARDRHSRQSRSRDQSSPVLRPLVWSATLGAAVAFAFATPVYADPPLPNTVPDTGARPAPIGAVRLPGAVPPPAGGALPPGVSTGPLAIQLAALETEVATLGEQLLGLRQNRDAATTALATARTHVDSATAALARARSRAQEAAGEALKEAAALPPGAFGSDLHGLGALSRIQRGKQDGTDLTVQNREVVLAEAALRTANEKVVAATGLLTGATTAFDKAAVFYHQRETALLALRRENQEQLLLIERARDAAEQRLGAGFLNNESIAGMTADPRAVAAVRYALAQLGDPYLWGAEGPNRFDCSGLMWAAYRSPGAGNYPLPRVAKDQYYATRHQTVSRSALLPGDLVFFASGSSWTTVHHVGMYIGGGKMVHAPTSGDVVKISSVRWSKLYAATRLFRSVPAPKPPSSKPPTTKPPTQPTPTPSTPTPRPTTPSPTPTTPSPSPTTPSPTPTATPTGPTPSQQPSNSVAPSGSTSAES